MMRSAEDIERIAELEAERDSLVAQIKRMKALADEAYGSYAACHESECASALTQLINAEEPPK